MSSEHSAKSVGTVATASAEATVDIEDRAFRAVADYTYDWESWHGVDGRLIWVNPAVERVTGYLPKECQGMEGYPLPLVASEDRPKVAIALREARRQTSGENIEFRCLHKSGETRWLSLAWQPMYEGGSYLGFRTSVRDVTDRHNLREQLRMHAEHLEQLVQERTARLCQLESRQRQMEKLAALGQLAAGVAHEINNPLAGIRNTFQLIRSEVPPDSEHYALMDLVDREIERISAIILQMYQLYRPSTQKASTFHIEQAVREVICLLQSAAKKRGVELDLHTADGLVVQLPESEVKQVFYNLIRNAIQASPPNETVHLRLTPHRDYIEIAVQDRGPGIPAEDVPRLFEPFFTTKHGGSDAGMGLGLSISQSLIEAMGGQIEVATAPSQGSVFTARLPRQAVEIRPDA